MICFFCVICNTPLRWVCNVPLLWMNELCRKSFEKEIVAEVWVEHNTKVAHKHEKCCIFSLLSFLCLFLCHTHTFELSLSRLLRIFFKKSLNYCRCFACSHYSSFTLAPNDTLWLFEYDILLLFTSPASLWCCYCYRNFSNHLCWMKSFAFSFKYKKNFFIILMAFLTSFLLRFLVNNKQKIFFSSRY